MTEPLAEYHERAAALERAAGRCERCGEEGRPKGRRTHGLEVHHVQRVADGGKGTRENFLVLCLNCHDAERAQDARDRRAGNKRCYVWAVSVDLTDRQEAWLRAQVKRTGRTRSQLVRDLLDDAERSPQRRHPQPPAPEHEGP